MSAQDKANRLTDALEHDTLTRISEMYAGALKTALKKKKAFLQTLQDVQDGKIQPPQYYIDRGEEGKWRQGFVKQLVRQNAIIDDIVSELNKAGVDAAGLIRGEMLKVYQTNRNAAIKDIGAACTAAGQATPSFAVFDKKQLEILVSQGQSPFSKVAYMNLGQNPAVRRRLQLELGQATILGEGQGDIIKRIVRAINLSGQQGYRRAKRIAQTERTRVQSQARWETAMEAADMGINMAQKWTARMVNTRDSHAALNGTVKPMGEPFTTIWGNTMRYPGDPQAPGKEVINCHCVLVPMVLLPGEEVTADGEIVSATEATESTRKPAFTPASTIEEAEAYAERFVETYKSDYSGKLSYKGLDLEYANELNRALTDVFERYSPKNPLRNIGPMNFRKNQFKGAVSEAEAAYQWIQRDLFFNQRYFKNKKTYSAHWDEIERLTKIVTNSIDALLSQPGINQTKEKYLEALKKSGVQCFVQKTDQPAYGTFIHELGHFLDDEVFRSAINRKGIDMGYSRDQYAGNISGYASTTRHEYVAESFSAFWFGKPELCDPALIEIFEEAMK